MIHKYLFRRNQTFYFRWRVFSELQSSLNLKEIKFSLHADSFSEAYVRAVVWVNLVHYAKLLKKAYITGEITKGIYLQEMKKRIEKIQTHSNSRSNSDSTTELIRHHHADGSITEIDYDGDMEKELKAASMLKGMENSFSGQASMSFSGLCNQFLEYKVQENHLNIRIQNSYRLFINSLIAIMGDIQIVNIRTSDIKDALEAYKMLPKRNLKKYKHFSVKELLERKAEIPDEDRLSEKSVLEVKKFLQGVFLFALERRYLKESPITNLKVKFNDLNTYSKFEDFEVIKILNSPELNKQTSKKWICWIAAYSGARRSEIIQLRKDDIKINEKTQRYYFHISDEAGKVKTKNAIRQVPIHKKLLEAGFLDFVKARKNNAIFHDVNSESFTKWFSKFRDSLDIHQCNDYGQRRVFHSFRHSFITKSRAALIL